MAFHEGRWHLDWRLTTTQVGLTNPIVLKDPYCWQIASSSSSHIDWTFEVRISYVVFFCKEVSPLGYCVRIHMIWRNGWRNDLDVINGRETWRCIVKHTKRSPSKRLRNTILDLRTRILIDIKTYKPHPTYFPHLQFAKMMVLNLFVGCWSDIKLTT